MFPGSNPSLASSVDPSLAFLTGGTKSLWNAPLLQSASVPQHDLSTRGSTSDLFARSAIPSLSSSALDFQSQASTAPSASFAASSAPSTNLLVPQRSLLPPVDLGLGLPDLRALQAFQQLQAMQTLQTLQNLSNLQAIQSTMQQMPSSQNFNLPLLMSAAAASNVGPLSALNAALALGAQNANQYGPVNDPTKSFKSIIECGIVRGGQRVLTEYCDYFGKDVEIFTALADNLGPERRTLYKASLLANKFQCATNKLAMYLSRRRHMKDGIFQAIMFTCKPEHSCGLKTGSYLVSLDACKEFENYYAKRKEARQRNLKRRNRHAEAAMATAGDSLRGRTASAAAPAPAPTASASSSVTPAAPVASSPSAPSATPTAPAPSSSFDMPLSEVAHPAHNLAYSDEHFPLFSSLDHAQSVGSGSPPSISANPTGLDLPSL